MKELVKNKWFVVSVVLALLLFLSLLWKKEPTEVLTPGPVKTVYLDDSTKYYEQQVAIAQSKLTIVRLQDSLEKAVSKNSGSKPVTITRATASINYDSLYAVFNSPLRDSVEKYKGLADSLFAKQTLAEYEYKDKWLYQKGRVTGGGIAIDSLSVTTKPHIMISEKGGLFKKKELVMQIVDENPNVSYSGIQSYTHKTKDKKIGLTLGPTVSWNGKFHIGFGLTYGIRL